MIFFPATRRVALQNLCFSSPKSYKTVGLGLNSVKLSCSNCILPFDTSKSVRSSKIFFFLFFKLLIFFPISKPFDFITPPPPGGGNTQLYTPLYFLFITADSGFGSEHESPQLPRMPRKSSLKKRNRNTSQVRVLLMISLWVSQPKWLLYRKKQITFLGINFILIIVIQHFRQAIEAAAFQRMISFSIHQDRRATPIPPSRVTLGTKKMADFSKQILSV